MVFFLRGLLMNRELFKYSYTLRKEKQSKNTKIIMSIIISMIFVCVYLNFVAFPIRQTSSSMNPDLPVNSVVSITPIVKTPDRGDIILIKPKADYHKNIFKNTGNEIAMFFTAQQIDLLEKNNNPGSVERLRRVVAMPGDTIYMKDYKLYVKPRNERHFLTEFELSEKTYNVVFCKSPADWDNAIGITGDFDEMTLGNDEYFVLSDDRLAAEDSRLWGQIKQSEIVGKAFLCYFPFNKMKFLF